MKPTLPTTQTTALIAIAAIGAIASGVMWAINLQTAALSSALATMLVCSGLALAVTSALKKADESITQLLAEPMTSEVEDPNKAQLQRLQGEWIPTISGQLGSVKQQMDDAITELTHSFEDIHHKLGSTVNLASEASDTIGGSGLASEVEVKLRGMLDSINHALEEKVSMFNEVKSFITSTDELAKMASSVEDLAAKTNLLALNAAIEAARAGEDGRGFSIVADEVRKLSMLSAETGQQIRQRVEQISSAARRAGEGATRMQLSDGKLLGYAQETVTEVVSSFQQVTDPLKDSAQQIVSNTSDITSGLHSAVTHFQFQDRVCQILGHVDDSLNALQRQLAGSGMVNVDSLMSDLSRHYTMAEERVNHGRPASSASQAGGKKVANAGKSGDMDITFF